MTAIGLEHAITAVGHHELEGGDRWLLTGGLVVVMLALALIQVATDSGAPGSATAIQQQWTMRFRLVGAALILLVGLLFGGGDVTGFVVALTVACALQVAGDVWIADQVNV